MRVLVTGGRAYDNIQRLTEILDALRARYGEMVIIHGGCRRRVEREDGSVEYVGADYLAGQWAAANGMKQMVFPAKWTQHGLGAGPRRNAEMLEKGEPTLVVAFPSPGAENKGTRDMVAKAQAAGVQSVWVQP